MTLAPALRCAGIAVDASTIVCGGHDLLSLPLDGDRTTPLVTGRDYVMEIAVDKDSLYWVERDLGVPSGEV